MTFDELLTHFRKGAGKKYFCPAHDDQHPSLEITKGEKRAFFNCWSQDCLEDAILAQVGLTSQDVWFNKPSIANRWAAEVVYDYPDEHGTLLYQEVRLRNGDGSKKIVMRRPSPNDSNEHIYNLDGIRRVLYNLDKLQGQQMCAIVEGTKCADRLTKAGLLATTNPNGAGQWRNEYTQQLVAAGLKCIILFPDHDKPGEKHVTQVKASCEANGLTSYVVRLPGLPPKGDVSDFLDTHTTDELLKTFALYHDGNGFHRPAPGVVECSRGIPIPDTLLRPKLAELGGTPEEIDELFAAMAADANTMAVARYEPDIDDRLRTLSARPMIWLKDLDFAETLDVCWKALQDNNEHQGIPVLYRHGDAIVRLARDLDGNGVLRPMNHDRLKERLARAADFRHGHQADKSSRPAYPPPPIVNSLLSNEEPPLPVLRRIVKVPVFAPDGRLLAEPGYDAASGILYGPPKHFTVPSVPAEPTAEELAKARGLILDHVLRDFPFAGRADKANFVALLVTTFARGLFNGVIPLFLIAKPAPGTGATLLLDVIGHIVLGRSLEKMSEGGTDDEWRKRITSCLLEAPPYIVIDNIRRKLDSAALATALTTGLWKDRELGSNRMLTLEILSPWIATANNPSVSTEMARRIVPCWMDAKVEQPDKRTHFQHDPLLVWIAEQRAELVWSCLTFVQNWIACGKKPGTERLASYEQWSATLGGILRDAGIPGFLANMTAFRDRADAEGKPWRAFVAAWWRDHGDAKKRVKELLEVANEVEGLDLGRNESEKARQIKLGQMLKSKQDTRYRPEEDVEVALVCEEDKHAKANLWRLMRVGSANIPQEIPPGNCSSEKDLRDVRDDAGCLDQRNFRTDTLSESAAGLESAKNSGARNIPHYPQHPAGRPGDCRRHPVTPRPDLCPECGGEQAKSAQPAESDQGEAGLWSGR